MKTQDKAVRATNDSAAIKDQAFRETNADPTHKSVPLPEGADLSPHAVGGWRLISVVRASRPDWIMAYFERLK